MAARVEDGRRLSDDFLGAVAGDVGERLVDAQDGALGIGHKHALLRLERNGGDALVGLRFQSVGMVAAKQFA